MNTESSIQIETLDRDGALRETAEKAGRAAERRGLATRRGVMIGGGAAVATLALSGVADAKAAPGDLAILNYALTLEYLEAAFYAEAHTSGALKGDVATFAKVVGKQEATHVATITSVIKKLGGTPVAKPTFDFKGTTGATKSFLTTSLALETTGVSAYLGQGAKVQSNAVLADAVAILAVEARHQAWVSDLIGHGTSPSPSPSAFSHPRTMAQVLAIVKKTGFITSS